MIHDKKLIGVCGETSLAQPFILAECLTHVKYKHVTAGETEFSSLYSVLSLLSYMLKAPLVKPGLVSWSEGFQQPLYSYVRQWLPSMSTTLSQLG